jgi:hypothetical protein
LRSQPPLILANYPSPGLPEEREMAVVRPSWRSPRLGVLAHPALTGAVAVLAVNDQVLKARLPGWWTGKLSDLAGVFVVAAVLGVLAGRPRAACAARWWLAGRTVLVMLVTGAGRLGRARLPRDAGRHPQVDGATTGVGFEPASRRSGARG